MKKLIALSSSFTLAILLVVAGPKVGATSGKDTRAQKSSVDFFDVADMPLSISEATLSRTADGHVLKYSATNRSDEKLTGFHLIFLIVNTSGKLTNRSGWMERAVLESYSSRELSFPLPVKLRVRRGDRIVLAVEEVVGRESIWKVLNAKEAFTAYATNEQYVIPRVQRVVNQVDTVPGIRML